MEIMHELKKFNSDCDGKTSPSETCQMVFVDSKWRLENQIARKSARARGEAVRSENSQTQKFAKESMLQLK